MGFVRTSLLAALLTLTAAPAAAKVSATLTAEPAATDPATPCRPARLTVANGLSRPVAAVRLKADDGGGARVEPMTIAPGRTASRVIRLPATSPHQSFTIGLLDRLDADAAPLGETRASIRWPADAVDAGRFLHGEAVGLFAGEPATWPGELRGQVIVCAAATVVFAGLCLLIRSRRRRALAALAVMVAGTGATAWLLKTAAPARATVRTMHILQRPAQGATTRQTLTILQSPRTMEGTVEAVGRPWPIYADRADMAADETVLVGEDVDRTTIRYRLGAGQTRIFAAATGLTRRIPRPALVTATADETTDEWILQANRPTPQAVWIRGGRIARVDAMAARTPRRIDRGSSEPFRRLRGQPERFGFDAETLKLLLWWDLTGRDVQTTYLVWPSRLDDGAALYVATVSNS